MSKYSIQNECLEMIEAFSDEQMSSDMAVIESVLDIFNKTILMMELSNEPVDIPDVSMFMESAFYQEEGDQPPAADGEKSNTAPAAGQSSNNNNTSSDNNTMSEADRKAYNKEHWVRMKNKKGKVENIFISIIAFIPRLLGFIVQSIVRFFKNLSNKDTDKKAETVANATDDQKAKAAEQVGETVDSSTKEDGEVNGQNQTQNNQPQTNNNNQPAETNNNNQNNSNGSNNKGPSAAVNVKNSTVKYFDADAVTAAISDLITCIDNLRPDRNSGNVDFNDVNTLMKAISHIQKCSNAFASLWPQAKAKFDAAILKEVEIDIKAVPNVKTKIGNSFNDLQKFSKLCWKEYSDMANSAAKIIRNENKDENGNMNTAKNEKEISDFRNAIMPAKKMCEHLKALAQDVAKDGLGVMAKANDNYAKNIDILYNAITNVSHGNINNANANGVKNINNMNDNK